MFNESSTSIFKRCLCPSILNDFVWGHRVLLPEWLQWLPYCFSHFPSLSPLPPIRIIFQVNRYHLYILNIFLAPSRWSVNFSAWLMLHFFFWILIIMLGSHFSHFLPCFMHYMQFLLWTVHPFAIILFVLANCSPSDTLRSLQVILTLLLLNNSA